MSNLTKIEKETTEKDWLVFLEANFITGKEKIKCIEGFLLNKSFNSQKYWLSYFKDSLKKCIKSKNYYHAYGRFKIHFGEIKDDFPKIENQRWNDEFHLPINRIFEISGVNSKYKSPLKMMEDCILGYNKTDDRTIKNNFNFPLEDIKARISDLKKLAKNKPKIQINMNASAFAYFIKSAIEKGWFNPVLDENDNPSNIATARELLKVFEVKNTTKDECITPSNFADLFNPKRNNCAADVKRFFDDSLLKIEDINFKSIAKPKAKSSSK
ncbi:MAG: hypothetical protein MH472_02910 [Bacteroidia bacterium]|nr:hypothetical protein [Bacteroidia bacterium]